ncbi:hypothetical protein LF41_1919 [Lysobacter dokdonensis DS-58]|uniref:Uncharacterized protein n=1 Tax=Lysobacter dokdonensis DS-58 TaxID=1300345 RepID=A0A0A2WG90_9GAMM|nr:hypothetical protein LF41_1919 [Lysobacter dokdonensis DS-58]
MPAVRPTVLPLQRAAGPGGAPADAPSCALVTGRGTAR